MKTPTGKATKNPAMKPATKTTRVFKVASFATSARKAGITDDELCEAIAEVMNGQFAADLGGGVYKKKRLNTNTHRSIILAKCGTRWVYEYLFAKNERDNIHDDEVLDTRNWRRAMRS